MALSAALLFAVLSVGATLSTHRDKGNPLYQTRDQPAPAAVAPAAAPRSSITSNTNPTQASVTVQLPPNVVQSLLKDPRYASLIQTARQSVGVASSQLKPKEQPQRQQTQRQQQHQQSHRLAAVRPRPQNNNNREALADAQLKTILANTEGGSAQLIMMAYSTEADHIIHRLPSNASLIRPNLNSDFKCLDRDYGYYADQLNDCQVFHVCVPLHKLFPIEFPTYDTRQYSFICNSRTQFSQDTQTCTWSSEAIPCEDSQRVAQIVNANYFKLVHDSEKNVIRWAHVNEDPNTPTAAPGSVPGPVNASSK